jgi:hypothetical protein
VKHGYLASQSLFEVDGWFSTSSRVPCVTYLNINQIVEIRDMEYAYLRQIRNTVRVCRLRISDVCRICEDVRSIKFHIASLKRSFRTNVPLNLRTCVLYANFTLSCNLWICNRFQSTLMSNLDVFLKGDTSLPWNSGRMHTDTLEIHLKYLTLHSSIKNLSLSNYLLIFLIQIEITFFHFISFRFLSIFQLRVF